MTKPLVSKFSGRAGRRIALATTALPLLLLMSPLAFAAAPAAPAAGSLPGNFSVAGGTATYALSSSTAKKSANIKISPTASGDPTALTFGTTNPGVALTTSSLGTTLPSGVTQNSGFSIGSGASLGISGDAALLINDQSGNPSQIFGSVTNTGTGSMFVANASGVIVGAGGSIVTPAGLGLLGYAQSGSSFASTGEIVVNSSVNGGGDVAVDSGSKIGSAVTSTTTAPLSAPLLVASNGAINIGSKVNPVDVYSGYAIASAASGDMPTSSSALPSGSSSNVTFSGGATGKPILVAALDAAGSVTNSGITDFTDDGTATASPTIAGSFTNTGVATVGAAANSNFVAGSIVNDGELEATGEGLTLATGSVNSSGATVVGSGNVTNSGVVAFTTTTARTANILNELTIFAANIYFGGTIEQAPIGSTTPSALSSTNYLHGFTVTASYTPSGASPVPGVVDVASTIYSSFAVTGQAVRIMSGGLIDPTGDTDQIYVGAGAATDPFFNNAKLAYNLSLFGGTTVAAGSSPAYGIVQIINNSTSTSVFPNINLNGVLGGPTTRAIFLATTPASPLGNINGDATGGLSVADGGEVFAHFRGNMNNPYGMAQAGQTSYLYNSLPITVANATSGKAGTVNLVLNGPSSSSGSAQNVNVMVAGNVILADHSATATLPTATTPISPVAAYTNNHLIVQSTGNIQVGNVSGGGDGGSPATFYWPGLVYLSNASSASDPTALSASGSITLGSTVSGSSFATNLNNVVPAISTGGTGIFLETNNLALNGGTVTTSNNSWVNFANASLASAFKLTQSPQAPSFLGAYVDNVTSTVTELGVKALPTSAFQPAS